MSHQDNIFLFLFNSCVVEDDGTHCHLGITVWVNISQRFYGVISGSGWRAWWDVMVTLSEVPLIHYGARTSAFSLHWNKYFPLSLFFMNWNQVWAVSCPPSIDFTHSYQSLPDLEADHCPCLEKDQELHQGGWVSSLGVGQRKESLGGSKFRENHPKMSCLLYTLLCPCRRSSLKSDLLWKIPEKSLNWGCSSLDARWSSAPGWLAGCGQAELPFSEQVFSSHLIIITCYSCFSLEHDLLQPLNSNANFLQMFLAKLWMNLLRQFPEPRQTLCSCFRWHFLAWRPQI